MNETEQEQHALAANAAGYTGFSYEDGHCWIDGPLTEAGIYPVKWSPRHDDGDAFRMMVGVRMEVHIDNTTSSAGAYGHGAGRMRGALRLHHDDPHAATREAIFLAAVELGRALK